MSAFSSRGKSRLRQDECEVQFAAFGRCPKIQLSPAYVATMVRLLSPTP
jgi:hypothetical protein